MYTYDYGLVLGTDKRPLPGGSGVLREATVNGPGATVTIYDMTGTTIPQIVVSEFGVFSPFQADNPRGYLDFGGIILPVASVQVLDSLSVATAARDAAQNSSAASAAAAASAAQTLEDLRQHLASGGGVGAQRAFDTVGLTWPARPLVPAGTVVTSYSTLSVTAPMPPGSQIGDIWYPHPSSTAGKLGQILTFNGTDYGVGTASGSTSSSGGGSTATPVPTPAFAFGFNEGSGTSTVATNGVTGTLKGQWAVGKYGSGVVRTAAGGPIAVVNPPTFFANNPTTMTYMLWVNVQPGTVTNHSLVVWCGADIGGFLTEGGQAGAWFRSTTGVMQLRGGTNVSAGWHHFAASFDNGQLKLFLDAVQVATAAAGPAVDTSGNAGKIDFSVGGYTWSDSAPATPVDELRVYAEALTAEQIQAIMATPVSGSATSGTGTNPAPAPTGGLNDQTSVVPIGDVVTNGRSWHQVLAEDFNGSSRPASWVPYSATGLSGAGIYNDSVRTTYHDGMMDIAIRRAVVNGRDLLQGTAGRFGTPDVTVGMRTAIRFRTDKPATGCGEANMIWPANDVWGEGEIDIMETQFDETIKAFIHETGANPQNNAAYADTGITPWSGFHTVVTEWVPGAYTRGFIDGRQFIEDTRFVPTTKHDWRFQVAGNGGLLSDGCNFQIQWVAQWLLVP